MRSYDDILGIAIEPILEAQTRFLLYSHQRHRRKSFTKRIPVSHAFNWVFANRAVSFVENHSFECIQNCHPREFMFFPEAISSVPGKRKTESQISIFLSVWGKCEYEMCLVSTWKADMVYLCCCTGLLNGLPNLF